MEFIVDRLAAKSLRQKPMTRVYMEGREDFFPRKV